MLKFGLQNFRRLQSVSPIELKPITLLVGRNSSGKSSFLRTLPLFRQSLTTRISSPILWYGDFVDFGSFESSSGNRNKNSPITFSFIIDELSVDNSPNVYVAKSRIYKDEYEDISIDVSIIPYRERTRIGQLKISVGGDFETEYLLKIDEHDNVTSILVNGIESIKDIEPYCIVVRSNSLFPELIVMDKSTKGGIIQGVNIFSHQIDNIRFYKSLDRVLRRHMDGRLAREKIDALLVDMIVSGFPNNQYIKSFGKAGPKVLTAFLNDLTGRDSRKIYPEIKRILSISALIPLAKVLSTKLRLIFSSTLYIGPARARSERYYRYQDLAVTEIDPDGKNLPIFLSSLPQRQLARLSAWIESLFGYGISIAREKDHISINLVEKAYRPNIVDVGYGVSQILPVLGQIWWAKYRTRRINLNDEATILAIEQPELHLHPAHQALLADAFVGIVQKNSEDSTTNNKVHYVVETHSETLVNRLGELVSEGKILSDNVQIVLFERNKENDEITSTRTVNFDKDGTLIDWPYGFFQPSL